MLILKGHNSAKPVRSLAFSPDNVHLASSARDYQTRLWDLNVGTSIVIEEGHADSYSTAFSHDGGVVATGKRSAISLYTLATRELRTLEVGYDGMAMQVAFSSDGKWLGAVGGTVRLWSTDTLEEVPLTDDRKRGQGCLAFRRDSTLLASAHSPWTGLRQR